MRNLKFVFTAARAAVAVLLVAACGSRSDIPKVSGPSEANNKAYRLNARGCWMREQYEFDSAMVYFRQALALGEKYDLKERAAASLQNIAATYSERSFHSKRFDYDTDMDSSALYFDRVIAFCTENDLADKLPGVVLEQGTAVFRDRRRQKQADSLFRTARAMAREQGDTLNEGLVLFHLGQMRANRARNIQSLDSLNAAATMMDTAALLLRSSGEAQTAGSAEVAAEEMRELIARVEEGMRESGGR